MTDSAQPTVRGRTRVKVCGVRDEATARHAAVCGADAIGFIFVPGSPRHITPDAALPIMYTLPPLVTAVAVVRNLSVDAFCDFEQQFPAPLAQLHGDEDEATVRACGPGIVRAFRFDEATIDRELERWAAIDEVDAVLIDGSDGGEGTAFDWSALGRRVADYPKPIILAGGLDAANVGEAIAAVRPYAVDVSSGVEREPGVKDLAKIEAFCAAVRAADAE